MAQSIASAAVPLPEIGDIKYRYSGTSVIKLQRHSSLKLSRPSQGKHSDELESQRPSRIPVRLSNVPQSSSREIEGPRSLETSDESSLSSTSLPGSDSEFCEPTPHDAIVRQQGIVNLQISKTKNLSSRQIGRSQSLNYKRQTGSNVGTVAYPTKPSIGVQIVRENVTSDNITKPGNVNCRPIRPIRRAETVRNKPVVARTDILPDRLKPTKDTRETVIQTFLNNKISNQLNTQFRPVNRTQSLKIKGTFDDSKVTIRRKPVNRKSFEPDVLGSKSLLPAVENITGIKPETRLIRAESLRKKTRKPDDLANELAATYVSENLAQMLANESKYKQHFQCTDLGTREQTRIIVVEWVITASLIFEFTDETIHTTIYIIDAFLKIKWTSLLKSAWALLALAALHVASKMEEVRPVKLVKIMEQFTFLRGFEIQEVNWMETWILKVLDYEIRPPTSKFFADLFITSGQIEVSSEIFKGQILKLTRAILIKSLKEYKFSQILPSEKARAAIQVAIEYLQNLKSHEFVCKDNDFLREDSLHECMSAFYNVLKLEKSKSIRISM